MGAGTDYYKQPNNEILLCYQCGSISLKDPPIFCELEGIPCLTS